ncbi:MAG TPA: hypothetical protein PLT76_03755 [Candidatus Omnitrophota bacterium]|nr:hypothetical protein [Candidatus Omnitrophota bacterium]HPB68771.1 hypothetical protein [Candidatus Omnitrophota bacterium]HQO57815.1 hypothetical protein [Candidatus Omnitrophota bacterium]HQP12787.1 hypothetical protein [Candidatus Omnitrophota bacterium]
MNQETGTEPKKEKLPLKVHVMCGWPLILVLIGGLIGGGLGAGAYVINRIIYKSKLPVFLKVIFNICVGLSAFVLWLVIVSILKGFIQ